MKQGAHHVIDHQKPLSEELKRIGVPNVTHIASLNQTAAHFDQYVDIIAPQGRIAYGLNAERVLSARSRH